jgi:hypothetical protein
MPLKKSLVYELSEVHEHNAITFLVSYLTSILFRILEKTSANKLIGPIEMGKTLCKQCTFVMLYTNRKVLPKSHDHNQEHLCVVRSTSSGWWMCPSKQVLCSVRANCWNKNILDSVRGKVVHVQNFVSLTCDCTLISRFSNKCFSIVQLTTLAGMYAILPIKWQNLFLQVRLRQQ